MRYARAILLSAMPLSAVLLLAACETVTPNTGKDLDSTEIAFGAGAFQNPAAASAPRLADDPTMDWSDPCAGNLQELMGSLLLYYRIHGELPPSLENLPATSPSGDKLSLTCPKSGKPYQYYPKGFRAPEELGPMEFRADGTPRERNRLIVYDAVASHEMVLHLTDGKKTWNEKQMVRFGIVLEPVEPGRPVKMYVVPLQQAMLDMYLKMRQ